MTYPTLAKVETADRLTLARWYRFLPSPKDEEQIVVIGRIAQRFHALGGFTPEISKEIGL